MSNEVVKLMVHATDDLIEIHQIKKNIPIISFINYFINLFTKIDMQHSVPIIFIG